MSFDVSKLTPAPWKAMDYLHEADHFTAPNGEVDEGWQILGDNANDDGYAVASGQKITGIIFPEWTDLEFIALARNAFDVMMRRGWGVTKTEKGWWLNCSLEVCLEFEHATNDSSPWQEPFSDPFTALVEADKWYKVNVEAANKEKAVTD